MPDISTLLFHCSTLREGFCSSFLRDKEEVSLVVTLSIIVNKYGLTLFAQLSTIKVVQLVALCSRFIVKTCWAVLLRVAINFISLECSKLGLTWNSIQSTHIPNFSLIFIWLLQILKSSPSWFPTPASFCWGLSVYVDLQIWHFRDQIPTLS